MEDDDRSIDQPADHPVDQHDAAVPRPRTAGDDVPGPPGTRRQWVTALGEVAGLLLALREAEADGAVPPLPLAGGHALRAWSAVTRPVLRDPGRITIPGARREDLAAVAAAARLFGRSLCRWRAGDAPDILTTVVRAQAAVHERDPEWLVAQVARIHGVLSAPDPVSARIVWEALDDGDEEHDPWADPSS
jgi:hypothetical protein